MAHTLFQLLKQRNPGVRLEVMAPAWSRALLDRMPEVDEALLMPLGHGQLALKQRYQLGKALRSKGYDQAIVLPNSFKSALIPFFANIPQRTGWWGECRLGVLNDYRKLDKTAYPLMVQRYAALAFPCKEIQPAALPWPYLHVEPTQVSETQTTLGLKLDKPILALCPGAEFGPSKQWPAHHYAQLAKLKLKEGWQVWLLGSVKDHIQTQLIQEETQFACIDLAGKTSLAQAIDVLSLANKVVSNDSGLMHIVAALKRPLVAVYGSTDPRFTPPLSEQVRIVSLNLACSPCFKRVCPLSHHHCMQQLIPERVNRAMDEL